VFWDDFVSIGEAVPQFRRACWLRISGVYSRRIISLDFIYPEDGSITLLRSLRDCFLLHMSFCLRIY